MTKSFIDMLKLFACGAAGVEFKAGEEINIDEVRHLAIEQGIWQTVFAGISDTVKTGGITVNSELFDKLKKEVFISLRRSTARNEYTNKILLKSNLKYCVLKGQTIARFYKYPDMRVSGDVDILIEPDEIQDWIEFLKNADYLVEQVVKGKHHFEAKHTIGGLLEVHTRLYEKTVDEVLIKGLYDFHEPYINGGGILALGVNDALVFLTIHLLKHFLNGAAGLRQICDLLMHMRHYNSEIDWKKYNELMETLGFTGFVSAIRGIGSKYFGFDFEDADEALGDILLDDTEIGGNFGHNDSEKGAFYYWFLRDKSDMPESGFDRYFTKQTRGGKLSLLFPNLKTMQKRYTGLSRYPFLLPAYWALRWVNIFCAIIGGRRTVSILPSAESESVKRRRELTKKLGMMK